MDWRRNRSLFVCVLLLLMINVDCFSIPFGNPFVERLPPSNPQPSNPISGVTPCLKNCMKSKPNPCVAYIGRGGCPPPPLPTQGKSPFSQHEFNIVSSLGFGQQWQSGSFSRSRFVSRSRFGNPNMQPPPLQRTTTTTATTTVTVAKDAAIHKKDVTEEQNNTLTTTASPPPPPTTKTTGGITVNADPFWMMFKRK